MHSSRFVCRALSLVAFTLGTTAAAQPSALSVAERAKIELMLRDRLPCLGCHALGNAGGRLAPDLATARQRRNGAYVVAMVDDPQRTVPGTTMPRITMPSATRALLLRYLGAELTAAAASAPNTRPAGDTSGARLYAHYCAGCHGAAGRGDGPNARYLPVPPAIHGDAAAMSRRTDDRLYDAIAAGGATLGRSPRMPPFGETLQPTQIAALVRHIRTLCRCEQPRWAADGTRR